MNEKRTKVKASSPNHSHRYAAIQNTPCLHVAGSSIFQRAAPYSNQPPCSPAPARPFTAPVPCPNFRKTKKRYRCGDIGEPRRRAEPLAQAVLTSRPVLLRAFGRRVGRSRAHSQSAIFLLKQSPKWPLFQIEFLHLVGKTLPRKAQTFRSEALVPFRFSQRFIEHPALELLYCILELSMALGLFGCV